MATALYDKGREAFLNGDIDWDTDDIRCVLVDTGTYTVNLATHDFHDDLSGIVATSGNFSGKTITAGVADADNVTFSAVSGSTVEAIVIYKWTGVSGTSPLIAYIDSATGLPVTPNGGDITVTWDNGANKIFKL
jgi:hypothetical protein